MGVGERDFYRTRLTHSLEVAQLGRGLCGELEAEFKPDPELVETIALAHDIGHAPFGHSGEDFLNEKLKNNGGFGANPQNLRIVTLLEAKYPKFGLDLTRATLDGLVKYPRLHNPCEEQKGKFTYKLDEDLLKWIKKGVTASEQLPLEAQIADWADQMAYSVNDIEDVVRAGLLSFPEMKARAAEILAEAKEKFVGTSAKSKKLRSIPKMLTITSIEKIADEFQKKFITPKELRQRKINLKAWTSATIKELKRGCKIVDLKNGATSVRYRFGLSIPPKALAKVLLLKAMASILIFSDPRVTTLEAKGHNIIDQLFDIFCNNPKLLPLDFQELIKAEKFGPKERLVADFIAGMTDRYAFTYYKRLFHPGTGSFYEDV